VDLVVEERGGSFRVVAQPKLDTDGGISAGGVNVRFYCVFALGCVVFEKRYLVHVWRCVVESSEHPPSLRRNGAMNLNEENCGLRAARSAVAATTQSSLALRRCVNGVVRDCAKRCPTQTKFENFVLVACVRAVGVETPLRLMSSGVTDHGRENASTINSDSRPPRRIEPVGLGRRVRDELSGHRR